MLHLIAELMMKYLLISIAILGIVYVVFIDEKKPIDSSGQPEALYQREVEKAEAVETLLQETVDQRFGDMGLDKEPLDKKSSAK